MEKYFKKLLKKSIVFVKIDTNDNDLAIKQLPKYTTKVIDIKDLGIKNGKYYKRISFEKYSDISYEELVAKLVAEKYTQAEESAIQRKAIMNGITDEFLIYNAYVEDCKAQAKAFVQEREKVVGGN